jgi:hypothetical protein
MNDNFNREWPETYYPTSSEIEDITVTSLGVAFRNSLPILNTLYRYPYSLIKGIALAVGSCHKNNPRQIENLTTPAFVHSQWSRGYYHWITESLPRAVEAVSTYPESVVFIPNSYNSFHPESLMMLGISFSHFPDHNIKTKRAILTSCPKHYGTTAAVVLRNLRDMFRERANTPTDCGRKIYISRSLARGRRVANEDEVEDVLKELGFEILIPEALSFNDQVAIFCKADFLISIHGAGLTNMLFMKENSNVIELLPFRNGLFDFRPNSFSFKHDNCYLNLSRSMLLKYDYLLCKHDRKFYQKTNLSNIYVDCEKLQAIVKRQLD